MKEIFEGLTKLNLTHRQEKKNLNKISSQNTDPPHHLNQTVLVSPNLAYIPQSNFFNSPVKSPSPIISPLGLSPSPVTLKNTN